MYFDKSISSFNDESYSDDSLFNLVSYGADLTVRELVNMFDEGDLVKPDLQRNYVWNKNEASRFIDSVLLGLPVPSIFLAKDVDGRFLIVDGLQRITSLYDFIKGTYSSDSIQFRLSKKEIINRRWRGLTFEELPEELQRRLKGYTLHAIIFEKKNQDTNDTAMYQIFERINTGGRVLSSQEIRNCVYHGSFNNYLKELNKNSAWQSIIDPNFAKRMKDVEIILKSFAASEMFEQKNRVTNFPKYINEFMGFYSNKNIEELEERFGIPFNLCINHIVEPFLQWKAYNFQTREKNRITSLLIETVLSSCLIVLKKHQCFEKRINFSSIEELINDSSYINASQARTTNVENVYIRISRCLEILFGEEDESGIY